MYTEVSPIDYDEIGEGGLPPGQTAIETLNLEQFRALATLLTSNFRKKSKMGLATGRGGSGKTTAAQVVASEYPLQEHSGLRDAILFRVPAGGSGHSGQAVAHAILRALEEPQIGNTAAKAIENAVKAILNNHIKLLIGDEGDRLSHDSYDSIRDIFDRSHCPIILVGLPPLLSMVKKQEQFQSRIGRHISFDPLTKEEVINTILPKLSFERWKFDPTKEEDQKLGLWLWEHSSGSFRKLYDILDDANIFLMEAPESPMITKEIIERSANLAYKPSAEPKPRGTPKSSTGGGGSKGKPPGAQNKPSA